MIAWRAFAAETALASSTTSGQLDRASWLTFIQRLAAQAAEEAIPMAKVDDADWEAICCDELPVGTAAGGAASARMNPQWVNSGVNAESLWGFIAPLGATIARDELVDELLGFGLADDDADAFMANLPPSATSEVDRVAFDAAFSAANALAPGASSSSWASSSSSPPPPSSAINLAALSPADATEEELERFAASVGPAPALEGFVRAEWPPLFRAYADWATGTPGYGSAAVASDAEDAELAAAAAALAAVELPPMSLPPTASGTGGGGAGGMPAMSGMLGMPTGMPMPMPMGMPGAAPRPPVSAAASVLSGIAGFDLKALKKKKTKKKKKKTKTKKKSAAELELPERVDSAAARAACTGAGIPWNTTTKELFAGAAESDGTVARSVVLDFLASRRPKKRAVMSSAEVARRCRGLALGGGNGNKGAHRTTKEGGDAESKEAWFDEDWGTFDDDAALGKECPSLDALILVNAPSDGGDADSPDNAALYARSASLAATSALAALGNADAAEERGARSPLLVFAWASYQSGRSDVKEALRSVEALYRCARCRVRVLGLSTDAVEAQLRQAVASKRLPCTFPVAFDPSRAVRKALQGLADQASLHTPQVLLFDGRTGLCVWRESLLQHKTFAESQLMCQLGRT